MATDGSLGTLDTRKQKAIAALLTARDIQSAAAQAGVGVRTLHRWLDEDKPFREALRQAESQAIDTAVRRLTGVANHALTVLVSIMANTEIAPSVRLRASIAVLEQLIKLRELNTLEARIQALEAQLGADR